MLVAYNSPFQSLGDGRAGKAFDPLFQLVTISQREMKSKGAFAFSFLKEGHWELQSYELQRRASSLLAASGSRISHASHSVEKLVTDYSYSMTHKFNRTLKTGWFLYFKKKKLHFSVLVMIGGQQNPLQGNDLAFTHKVLPHECALVRC